VPAGAISPYWDWASCAPAVIQDHMIARILGPWADVAYAVLRIAAGLLFAFHGVQLTFGVLTEHVAPVGSQIWIGGIIELVTGVAVAAGAATRWAALLASGTMAVAYVQFHWKLSFGQQLFPAVNQGELALVYSLLFFYVACRGAVRWGLDRV
jgi:putative oxidoreductase